MACRWVSSFHQYTAMCVRILCIRLNRQWRRDCTVPCMCLLTYFVGLGWALNKGRPFPNCSCYNKPYCYFKQLGVPGSQPLPVVGNLVTLGRFKVGVSRGATYLLVGQDWECNHDIHYIHGIYKLCIVIVPASPSIIHTCVHTHTHTHIPCAVHVLHIHTIHLFSCTWPHAPVVTYW